MNEGYKKGRRKRTFTAMNGGEREVGAHGMWQPILLRSKERRWTTVHAQAVHCVYMVASG